MNRRISAVFVFLAFARAASSYSVLSHEAIIDAAWDASIKPILLKRFPGTTEEGLRKAHAFTYGGSIIQDMGYYPFGSHFFSDLTHYIRSGDFIVNLLEEAQDVNEYAFALGALAHYAADNIGHRAVNQAVPMLYPKVRAKFGQTATYEDNPADHLKTEFSFDVAEVAEHKFAPNAYHDFIGFEVSKPLLERAFEKTYGLPLKDVSKNLDLALGTYRHTVSALIPEMTKVAWQAKKKELMRANPGLTQQRFVYTLSRAGYEKEWGNDYSRPGWWSKFLACALKAIPKIGPLKSLAFHPATPEAQKLFMDSFVQTVALYEEKLREIQNGRLPALADQNFDTGQPSRAGDYQMADAACGKLILKLSEDKSRKVDPELSKAILAFYGDKTPTDPKVAGALDALRGRTERRERRIGSEVT